MNVRLSIIVLSCLAMIMCSHLQARDRQTLEKNAPSDAEVKTVHLETDLGAVEFVLDAHDGGDLFTAEVRYDADKVRVDVDYDKSGSSADLYLSSEKIRKNLDLDTDDCRWRVSLSRDYVWDIELDAGVTDGKIDLSGLPIESLGIDQGVSDCKIIFSEPNPTEMRRLSFDGGVGECRIIGLGYANVRDVEIDGGTGELVLNYDGFQRMSQTASIDMGVGSVTIEIPRGVPVRFESDDSWLNSIKAPMEFFDEVDDGVYETDSFEDADYRLDIKLDVGIGSAKIKIVE
jgi:hypothetical protein